MRCTNLITLARFLDVLQLLNLHQNNVIPDLAHVLERNDVFLLPPEDSAQAARPRNDQMGDAAVFRVKFHIAHKPSFLQSQMLMTSFFLYQKYA